MSQHNQATPQSDSQQLRGSPGVVEERADLLRILLLEDDADTCAALELLLCPEDGFELCTTCDVQSCLNCLRCAAGSGRPYDVLLLDLALSGGHWGTEVTEAAQRDPHLVLPAVVACTAISGSFLEEQRPMLDACGAQLVPKPFEIESLVQILRQAATGRE